MTTLVVCEGCSRHVRRSDARCPFCSRTRDASGLGRAALVAVACTSIFVAACGGTDPAARPLPEDTVATAAPTTTAPAPSAAPPTPAPVPEPTAETAPSAPLPPRDQTVVAAYGAPPRPAVEAVPSPVQSPNNGVDIGNVTVTGGEIGNANEVVQQMKIGFARCYEKGRATNPDAEGQVTVNIRVGAAGQVLGVNMAHTAKVPPGVVTCMTGRAAASEFTPPSKTKPKKDVTVSAVVTLKKP